MYLMLSLQHVHATLFHYFFKFTITPFFSFFNISFFPFILSTQSGGDTYFCIDTLLRDKDQDFSILTPLGNIRGIHVFFVDMCKQLFSVCY